VQLLLECGAVVTQVPHGPTHMPQHLMTTTNTNTTNTTTTTAHR
jgi:hypothetical protein